MRAVVQRVSAAKVAVLGEVTGAIECGLLVYLGVGRGDRDVELDYMRKKVLALRVFTDDAGKMARSVLDVGGSLLVVSQFTLYGDVSRGNRPGFDAAMPPEPARAMYDAFVREARKQLPVETGRFGARMEVTSVNDGPVTILLEARPPVQG